MHKVLALDLVGIAAPYLANAFEKGAASRAVSLQRLVPQETRATGAEVQSPFRDIGPGVESIHEQLARLDHSVDHLGTNLRGWDAGQAFLDDRDGIVGQRNEQVVTRYRRTLIAQPVQHICGPPHRRHACVAASYNRGPTVRPCCVDRTAGLAMIGRTNDDQRGARPGIDLRDELLGMDPAFGHAWSGHGVNVSGPADSGIESTAAVTSPRAGVSMVCNHIDYEEFGMDARINYDSNAAAAKFLKYLIPAGRAVSESALPAATRALVQIRASQINGCGACLDAHLKDAAQAGESAVRLNLVAAWREATVFTEAERAALELTEQGTRLADAAGGVTDEVWANAAKHYDDEQLGALVSGIALINTWNRLNVITRQPAGDYQPGQWG